MNKRKQQISRIGRRSMVALLALAMLMSVCVPGFTARASMVDTEPTESTTIPVETTTPQETVTEETTLSDETEPVVTIEEGVFSVEAKLEGTELLGETGEDDPAQDPEITALYNQIMAYTDIESYWAFLGTMTDDEQNALFEQFTEEQMKAINEHIDVLTKNAQSGYDAADVLTKLTATGTYTDLVVALNALTPEEKVFLNAFTEEQTAQLDDHVSDLVANAFANVILTITPTITANGRMSVTPTPAAPEGITYVYTWQRNGTDIARTPYDNDGDGENIVYNVGENGEWVNAALVQGSSNNPGQDTTYTVKLTGVKIAGLDKIYSVTNTNAVNEDSPYVAQLKNGSFETPKINIQTFLDDRNTTGLYWKTTDTTHRIELINEVRKASDSTIDGYAGYLLQYNGADDTVNHDAYWHGVLFMPDGDQAAEINADDTAALYQDVMTIPGVNMNWAFDHMGRPVSNGAALGTNGTATDSMYVVIMSTQLANTAGNNGGPVDTLAEVQAVRNRIQSNQSGYEGAKVIDISYSWVWENIPSNDPDYQDFPGGQRMYRLNANGPRTLIYTLYNNRLYQHNDPWVVHEDIYEVPDGQYMTRFFFVANRTSSNNTTMGNHIDNVWFAQTPRPAESGTANLVIKKELDGLTSEADIAAAKENLSFTVTVNGKESTVLGTQLTWDGNVGTYTVPSNFYTSSVTFTVSENVAANDMFELSTTAVSSSDQATTVNADQKTASGSLTKGESETITFKNTYTPAVTSVTIIKEVKGNMGDLNEKFSFTVKDQDGKTLGKFDLSDGESETIVNVPIGTTLTITEDNGSYVMEADKGTVNGSTVTYTVDGAETVTITITNTHNVNIDTGVSMDSMPYILLLSVAAVGAFVLLQNKRRYTGKF